MVWSCSFIHAANLFSLEDIVSFISGLEDGHCLEHAGDTIGYKKYTMQINWVLFTAHQYSKSHDWKCM